MLFLVILLYVLMHFHIIYNIFWTNLLIQCPVPVSVCFVRALQKKGKKSILPEKSQKIPEILIRRKTPEARRGAMGSHPLAAWPGGPPPGALLSPIFTPCSENPRGGPHFAIYATVPPPLRFRDRDQQKFLSRHPAGGRIDLRRPLLHHASSEMLRE